MPSTAAWKALTLIVEFCAVIALGMSWYTHGDVRAYHVVIVDRMNTESCVCDLIKSTLMKKAQNTFSEESVRNPVTNYFFAFSAF